jgi:hypothetical protein
MDNMQEDSKSYMIHVYQDRDFKIYLRYVPCEATTRKKAVKIMMEAAHKDIVRGQYYFYQVVEQNMKYLDTYPSTEQTEDI